MTRTPYRTYKRLAKLPDKPAVVLVKVYRDDGTSKFEACKNVIEAGDLVKFLKKQEGIADAVIIPQ